MNVGSTPFFAYEGLRILIPGSVTYGLLLASTPIVEGLESIRHAGTGVVISLAAGFFLYFVDLPALNPLYRGHAGLQFILRLGDDSNLDYYQLKNRYYIIFDTCLPSTLRDRSAYFLEIYRIGFEAILLLVIGSAAFWLRATFFYASDVVPAGAFAGVAGVLVVSLIGASRTPEGHLRIWRSVVKSAEQTGRWRLGLLVSGCVASLAAAAIAEQSLFLLSALVLCGLWTWWYVLGFRDANPPDPDPVLPADADEKPVGDDNKGDLQNEARVPLPELLSLLVAGLVVLIPIARLTAWRAWWFEDKVDVTAVLWLLIAVAAFLLIASNGHERRFLATNYEQREWLGINEEVVRKEMRLPASGGAP